MASAVWEEEQQSIPYHSSINKLRHSIITPDPTEEMAPRITPWIITLDYKSNQRKSVSVIHISHPTVHKCTKPTTDPRFT